MKILLVVLALSNLVHAGTEIPGSTNYTCINDADNKGVIIVSYKESESGSAGIYELDTSNDPHNAISPYMAGDYQREVDIYISEGKLVMKQGYSRFLPIPVPNPNGGWFRAGKYADNNKLTLDLEEMTLSHRRVLNNPNDADEANIDNTATYHDCKLIK